MTTPDERSNLARVLWWSAALAAAGGLVWLVSRTAAAQDPSSIIEAAGAVSGATSALTGAVGGGGVVITAVVAVALLSRLGVRMPRIVIGERDEPSSSTPTEATAPALDVDTVRLRQTVAAVIPERGEALDDRVAAVEAELVRLRAALRDNVAEQARIRGDVRRAIDEAGRLLAALTASGGNR